MVNIVWLRRNLRIDDNKVLYEALQQEANVQLIFILDTDILARFPNPYDRRLQFIKNRLHVLNNELKKFGSKILVIKGRPQEIIPKLATELRSQYVFADEDFEPSSIKRDTEVQNLLSNIAELRLSLDHLILHPKKILKADQTPFQVYTPYMKSVRASLVAQDFTKYDIDIKYKTRFASDVSINIESENIDDFYQPDPLWPVENVEKLLGLFIQNKIENYKNNRDFVNLEGTSKLSPYLRFGLVSIRECFRKTYDRPEAFSWVNELIWREFYAYILYHFPHSGHSEFNPKYKNLPWKTDAQMIQKVTNAETGYPIIDAAIKELVQTGWMHNRARMIVASFWTKNLLLDWRLGDELFAQYLMDYDLASNVGGWQWAASCGTDAQPYFRIFNPMLQARKFDPDTQYIKHYLPSLSNLSTELIHDFDNLSSHYMKPIVDYSLSREVALSIFKQF